MVSQFTTWLMAAVVMLAAAASVWAEGQWEVTDQSQRAAELGLQWLASHQRPAGNWDTPHLGLNALGVLAFLSAGHTPGKGKYGGNVERGLDYLIEQAKPSGLFNTAGARRDMYNHGLTTFVLTQAYGMSDDPRLGRALDRALGLISDVQCEDGGWNYEAKRDQNGHDLSLTVMQAKALRGARDIGMAVPPRTIDLAIKFVREQYLPTGKADGRGDQYGDDPLADRPGQFVYQRRSRRFTPAMAAAGAVCMQEFGQYDDFRIDRSMDVVVEAIMEKDQAGWGDQASGNVPFDAYTLYYMAQGLYQVGGQRWRKAYPPLRDALVKRQVREPKQGQRGSWQTTRTIAGQSQRLFGTAVAVFTLNLPNRYLPILQQVEEGQGPGIRGQASDKEFLTEP